MKLIIKKMIVAGAVLFVAQSGFASDQQQNGCLSVDVIRSVGVDSVEQDQDGTWAASKQDRYGTNGMWMVVTGPFVAQSAEEALRKGNEALNTLVFTSASNSPPWPVCEYTGYFEGKEIVGLAIPGNEGSKLMHARYRISQR